MSLQLWIHPQLSHARLLNEAGYSEVMVGKVTVVALSQRVWIRRMRLIKGGIVVGVVARHLVAVVAAEAGCRCRRNRRSNRSSHQPAEMAVWAHARWSARRWQVQARLDDFVVLQLVGWWRLCVGRLHAKFGRVAKVSYMRSGRGRIQRLKK